MQAVPKTIIESETKLNYIAANFPPAAVSIVRDFILKQSETELYEELKANLVKRTNDSWQTEIRKLLCWEWLGKGKSSELLRIMRHRHESHNASNELILELFLPHLPSSFQIISASICPLSFQKAPEITDRNLALNTTTVNALSKESNSNSMILNQIKKLNEQLQILEINCPCKLFSKTYQNPSHCRPKHDKLMWWYQNAFWGKSPKCTEPCKFSKHATSEV